jgi:hypothetical protein
MILRFHNKNPKAPPLEAPMHILRRSLTLFLLVFVLSFGSTVQSNQAAENEVGFSYLPLAMREEDSLRSMGAALW